MKASALISLMQRLIDSHGDLDCVCEDDEFLGEHWPVSGVSPSDVCVLRKASTKVETVFVIGSGELI